MPNYIYVEDRPIVLGLAGEAGSGKTATADVLAPPARVNPTPERDGIWWEPLAAAAPLYQMASILQKTEGEEAFDRKAYAVHEVLVDLFGLPGFGAPSYEDLVELVYDICCQAPAGDKPRTFLQSTGNRVRELMPDCFPGWLARRIQRLYSFFRAENILLDPMPMFGVVISDLRMENEAAFVSTTHNGIMIKLVADPEVRQERLAKRDGGVTMTEEQRAHATETWIAKASDDCFDAVIDTTSLTLSQQVGKVLEVVAVRLGIDVSKGTDNVSHLAERPRRIR